MKPFRQAFTLIELLVSMAILALIVVLVVGLLGNVSQVWSAGNQRAELSQTARAVVEMIGRELSVAEALPAGMQGNFKSYASSPLVVNPPLAGYTTMLKDADDVPMDSLFFFAPLRSTAKGPLVCVGYFTANDNTLRRVAVTSADTTYPAMAAANLPVYSMWHTSVSNNPPGRDAKLANFIQPVSWLNPASGSGFAAASTDANVTSTVAERVIGFVVRPIGRDGTPLPSPLLQSTAPTSTSGVNTIRAYNSSWWPVADGLPSEIEVTLVACEANAFRRLKEQNAVPAITMPADNSDAAFQNALTELKDTLGGKVKQYVIVTRRFPILRGSR